MQVSPLLISLILRILHTPYKALSHSKGSQTRNRLIGLLILLWKSGNLPSEQLLFCVSPILQNLLNVATQELGSADSKQLSHFVLNAICEVVEFIFHQQIEICISMGGNLETPFLRAIFEQSFMDNLINEEAALTGNSRNIKHAFRAHLFATICRCANIFLSKSANRLLRSHSLTG